MQALQQRVEQCFLLAEDYFSCRFERPHIELSMRRSKIAGSAHLQSNRLRFNGHFYQHYNTHFLHHTVAHEVAHLVCYQRYGRVAPHGKEWQNVMRHVFKLPATRTHHYDINVLGLSGYVYRCQCQSHLLSVRRHNKVQRAQAQYSCRNCASLLRFCPNETLP